MRRSLLEQFILKTIKLNKMGSLLKSLFGIKKNKVMQITDQQIQDLQEKYSLFDFQWIKGENLSAVEKFKGIITNGDFTFLEFQSGRRLNLDLIDEYVVTFPAASTDFTKNPEPQKEKTEIKKEIKPNSSVTEIVYVDSTNPRKDSPIYKLLKKQKENLVEVSIKIKMNLPPKELYNVLLGSFDEAEKEIIEFVLDGVDIENIKKTLAESIKKSYYSESDKSGLNKKINKTENIENE